MKTASDSAKKWGERAGSAAGDYVKGAQNTTKDQAANAKAAIPVMKAAINKAIDSGRVAKGLDKSGKAGWQRGIEEKGGSRYSEGVNTAGAQSKYATNSGAYDSARNASANMPRGEKGSLVNLAKVATVVNALRKQKVG
mgnify:CR=1 FL=1